MFGFYKVFFGLLLAIIVVIGVGAAPHQVGGHHEVGAAKKEIEEAVRETFAAWEKRDLDRFVAGWTDEGFRGKKVFRLLVRREFYKDEAKVFLGESLGIGGRPFFPLKVGNISNIQILGEMVNRASVDLELTEGFLKAPRRLTMIKRKLVDDYWKIDKEELLPSTVPNGFAVVDVKMTEYGFDFNKDAMRRNTVINLVNLGKIPHEMLIFYREPSGAERRVVRGAWRMPPGVAETLIIEGLPSGSYAMVCCAIDPDHVAHCDKGMRVEFAIP
jgi:hypothetical protein